MPERAPDPERRAFLGRLGWAAAGLAAAGAGTGWLLRAPGWEPEHAAGAPASFDFSVPGTTGRLGMGRGADRAASLDAALAAIGGLSTFVGSGDRVLLKVNAGFATSPAIGATTHPELLAALVRRCLAAGAAEVVVSDNPVADPRGCFQVTGIEAAAREAGARLLLPGPSSFERLTLPGGRLLRDWPVLAEPLRTATRVLSVCPLKHHALAGATMGLKNLYGLLGGQRGLFHQDLHALIPELGRLCRPSLVVIDATWAMVRNGPTGGSAADLEERGVVIAGSDPVAADACGAGLLGLEPADLPWLPLAARAGLGSLDWRAQLAGAPA